MGKSAKKVIRSLIVQGDSEDNKDRSKIIKSLDPIEPNKGNPIKLRSLANKTPEERDVILERWRALETADRLDHEILVEEGNMARMKILLDWYVEGYSIQADNYDQLEWIKYFISRDYQPGPNGTWFLQQAPDEPEDTTRNTPPPSPPPFKVHSRNPLLGNQESSKTNDRSPKLGNQESSKTNDRPPKLGNQESAKTNDRSPNLGNQNSNFDRSPNLGNQSSEMDFDRAPNAGNQESERTNDRPPKKGSQKSEKTNDRTPIQGNQDSAKKNDRTPIKETTLSLKKKNKSSASKKSSEEDELVVNYNGLEESESSSSEEITPDRHPRRNYVAIKEQVALEPLCKEDATVNSKMVTDFIDRLQRATVNGQTIPDWSSLIPTHIYNSINVKLYGMNKKQLNEGSFKENITNLRAIYSAETERKSSRNPEVDLNNYLLDLVKFFKEFKYPITQNVTDTYMEYVQKTLVLYGIPGYQDFSQLDEVKSKPFIDEIFKFYRNQQVHYQFFGTLNSYMLGQETRMLSLNREPCKTIRDFVFKLAAFFGECTQIIEFVKVLDHLPPGYREPPLKPIKEGVTVTKTGINALSDARDKQSEKPAPAPHCRICGRPAHKRDADCPFNPHASQITHPLVLALQGKPYQGSEVERRLKKAHTLKNGKLELTPYTSIPYQKTLLLNEASGKETLIETPDGPVQPKAGFKRQHDNNHEGARKQVSFGDTITLPQYQIFQEDFNFLFLNTSSLLALQEEPLITAEAVSSEDQTKKFNSQKILIDSGAIHYNFIPLAFVRKYKLKRYKLQRPIFTKSIHGDEVNTHCVFLHNKIKYNDIEIIMPNQQFIIVDSLAQYDLIVGLNDIRHYDLTGHLRPYFLAQKESRENTQYAHSLSTGGTENIAAADSGSQPKPVPAQTRETRTPGRGGDGTIEVYPKDLFMTTLDVEDQIDELSDESPWSRYFNTVNLKDVDKTHQYSEALSKNTTDSNPNWDFKIEGNAAVQATLRKLLEANKDCFATTVSPVPAKIKPFAFDVDHDGWHAERANKARARLQSASKNAAIAKFVNQAIADNVIAPSDAPAWSQVLLTPKPNGTWRFCLDYRTLNKYTKSAGWPIPNIQDVLASIGSHNPKFFAVMDCTSGYHQMPIEEQCQKYTTFTHSWVTTSG